MIGHRNIAAMLLAVVFGFAALPLAGAQIYPTRVIRLIVPYPAGGPTDVIARIVASSLSTRLGQSVIIENRPGGAAGTAGARVVVSADPDGYTLLISQVGSLTVAPSLYKLDYDPLKDFAPIAIVAQTPEILTVNPAVPAQSLAEFLAYAKSDPGKLNIGLPGTGTLPHLLSEQLELATGAKFTHVPYRGAGPATSDLLAGQVQLMIDSTSVLLPHIEAGRLRALAVSSAARLAQIPNVPTFAEAGYPQLTSALWSALLAPAGTPEPIIQTLNTALNAALKTPETEQAFQNLDIETRAVTPVELKTFMAAETHKWADVVLRAGIKGD